jgi:very-short-patch-repair endonuclease
LFGLCRATPPKDFEQIIALVDAVMEARRHQTVLRELQPLGASLFGAQWQGQASDWQVLQKLFDWIIRLYHDIGDGQLPAGILTFLSGNIKVDGLQEQIAGVERVLGVHLQQAHQVVEQLALDENRRFGFGQKIENLPLLEQEQLFSNWTASLPELSSLIPYNLQAETFQQEGLQEVLNIIETWPAAARHLTLAFERNWYERLVEKALHERPALNNFDGTGHAQIKEQFRQLDEQVINLTRSHLALQHWQQIPRHDAAGQLGILRREMEKKSRHLPIRQLMKQAGNAVQALKPVFMMSPLSIANYLPPNTINFDLVIFDEASQVKPVDALGAILRGKQLVVVGDSKQMPPTNFFDSMLQDEDAAEESTTQDMESILGFCVAQGMTQQLLRWHYRSRHESLIAVSNYEFYDNRLVVFPSPDHQRSEVGLVFRHLPHAHYQRGRGQINPEEAAAIAQAVMGFAQQQINLPPEQKQTLLVAAFSMAQKRAIEDRLEILRRQSPELEPFFSTASHEPFDVKNLETVQGDERDVVFISIGYGRDENGHLTLNFGPLNRDGGERRLNVLISRARRRCEVFTNLTDEDIDLTRTDSRGVKALKSFLAYARTGKLDIPVATGRATDSPFEDQVKAAMEAQGYEVHTQVGSSGFFIDLAIVDPRKRGRYLLGIECDGATYHSSRSARDRDRLRQQVLENLGWRIHRIWSTDWFRHPEREVKRLIAAIETAKTYSPAETTLPKSQTEVAEVQRIQVAAPAANGQHKPSTYLMWEKRIDLQGRELHLVPSGELARFVAEIVQLESPVHTSEVARRLSRAAGFNKVGKRISTAIDEACQKAVKAGLVLQRGEFLWTKETLAPQVRDRSNLPAVSRKLEFIDPAEIASAIEQVVQALLGIDREDVPTAVLRIFGFLRANEEQKIYVDLIIEKLLGAGRLKQHGSHLLIVGHSRV